MTSFDVRMVRMGRAVHAESNGCKTDLAGRPGPTAPSRKSLGAMRYPGYRKGPALKIERWGLNDEWSEGSMGPKDIVDGLREMGELGQFIQLLTTQNVSLSPSGGGSGSSWTKSESFVMWQR